MIYVCELLLSVQVGSKLADQVLRQQRRRSVMRRDDRAQAASGVQYDLSVGAPCQANDQAGHLERLPPPFPAIVRNPG